MNKSGAPLFHLDEALGIVRSAPKNHAAVIIDVFGSLIHRSCHSPEHVYFEAARIAQQRGILRRGIFPSQFRELRIWAENEALRQSAHKPMLTAIYSLLPSNIGDRARLLELELEVERAVCYLNPSIVSLIAALRKNDARLIFAADASMNEAQLNNLLKCAGLQLNEGDRLLVSSEIDIKKELKEIEQSNPPHIHYDSLNRDCSAIFDIEEILYGPILGEIKSLRSLAASLRATVDASLAPWHKAGAMVLGPFWTAVADWAMDVCAAEGADGIFPLMREACALTPLLKNAAEHRGMELKIVPLYASRAAAELALIDVNESDYYSSFFDKVALSVGELLNLFAADEVSQDFLAWKDVLLTDSWKIEIEQGCTLRSALICFLDKKETRALLAPAVETHRKRMAKYLSGLTNGCRKVITIDIGYRGTMQRAIEGLLKSADPNKDLTHLMAWSRGNLSALLASGLDIRTFADCEGEDSAQVDSILGAAMLFEQTLIGEGGTTIGYQLDASGSATPVCRPDPFSKQEHAQRRMLRNGMELYQQLWFNLKEKQPERIAVALSHRHEWNCMVQRLADFPIAEEAAALGELRHDVNSGSFEIFPICPAEEEALARKEGALQYACKNRASSSSPAIWKSGVIARVDPAAHFQSLAIRNQRGYFGRMLRFCSGITLENRERLAVYGAGEVGRQFMRAARMIGLKPICVVDRNRKLWGSRIEGIEIVSLEDAAAKGAASYAIASYAFIEEIRASILQAYTGNEIKPVVLAPE